MMFVGVDQDAADNRQAKSCTAVKLGEINYADAWIVEILRRNCQGVGDQGHRAWDSAGRAGWGL